MFPKRILFIIFVLHNAWSEEVNRTTVENVREKKDLRPNLDNHRYDEELENFELDSDVYRIDPDIVTNSHKPQFYENAEEVTPSTNRKTLDKVEIAHPNKDDDKFSVDPDDDEYKPSNHMRNKHNQIKSVLIKLLQKSEQRAKFANVLPILKVLTPPQRLVLASLISKQISSDNKNPALTTAQVEAMFGNNPNVTSDLMLPILLDIANMVREAKDHIKTQLPRAPQAQLLRRSFNLEEEVDPLMSHSLDSSAEMKELIPKRPQAKSLVETGKSMKIAATIPSVMKNSNVKVHGDLKVGVEIEDETVDEDVVRGNLTEPEGLLTIVFPENNTDSYDFSNATFLLNGTISEDLPVAEKLRALNRFIDRHGNLIVVKRPAWAQGAPQYVVQNRKSNNEQRRRVPPSRKTLLELTKQKCDLFTNSLCLDTMDYPTDAIMGSIRRNQVSMSALLADFPEVSADSAIDGISAKQENKYTPEFYLNNMNRREDGSGGASGFMCPSTVKYARPQKARATSGQWKYIVNTGEHTQTLRLEKCLRPKESCTYLTDNFKSRCVQVYNYHRLLTWDQENGLHMDIFKVPTCCSCHIEGYSVNFPPLSSKPHQSPAEHFPGQDIHGEEINHFDDLQHVQPSLRRPIHTSSFPGPPIESHNFIPGSTYTKHSFPEEPPLIHDIKHIPVHFDTGAEYHPDLFQHPSTNVRTVKKPPRIPLTSAGLPSYLEPPTKPNGPGPGNFLKSPEGPTKHKPFPNSHFKRGAPGSQNSNPPKRPGRRPLRKKTTNVNEDQMIGATSVHETPTIINMDTFEDINESMEEFERISPRVTSTVRTTSKSIPKITIKNVSPSTERYQPKNPPIEQASTVLKDIALNRRVNYNYHPIIDFFEEAAKKEASDRMDSGPVQYSSEETDWRPMAPPAAFPLKAPNPDKPPLISSN